MMRQSLAKTIIYGTPNDVQNAIQQGAVLDEVDEYGYTPLVQTAIVNDIEKAKVLLHAGALVDFSDLSGRTALHWAADNGNASLCELLLKNGANANAYTRAGQPVLAIPLLRNQTEIKKLLYQYGASVNFTLDFINGKLLGHRFELEGRIDIVDHLNTFIEIELEGFYTEFSMAMLIRSLSDFVNNFAGQKLRPYFSQFHTIIHSLNNGWLLLKYQHYLTDVKKHQKEIHQLLQHRPLVLPISYDGHAISLILFGSYLIRCDRGAFGREHGTVIIYKLMRPEIFDEQAMKFLLYKRQSRTFIDEEMSEALQLKVARVLKIPPQISGNCSWANMEATIPALLFLMNLQQSQIETKVDVHAIEKQAWQIYSHWKEWDKERALHFCIQSYRNTSPARQAAKATVLAAILIQYCQYGRQRDLVIAEKVLPILTSPDFRYILQAYLNAFADDPDHPLLKNLRGFLEDYGVML